MKNRFLGVFMRSKRWTKCVIVKKIFFKKHRFSTQAFEPEPVIHYDMTLDGSLLQPDILRNFHKMEIKKENKNEDKEQKITKEHENKDQLQSPDENATYTTDLHIADPTLNKRWPMFSVLDKYGKTLPGAIEPSIEKEKMIEMYRVMSRVQTLDDIFYNAQRQGRISFYMQSSGEEATQIGSAAALLPDDEIFAQYREVGVLLWRGFTVQQAADQCFGNASDLGKGRQMPVHYGSRAHHFQTISSPLATQLPQAVGAAYSLKISKKNRVAICFFGEGAASEGDFHAGLNMASTLEAPVIFFCRNNGYAISTPTRDQFRGDGIVSRAAGYGMKAVRVDGNDVFAVYEAVKSAREIALKGSCPVLIEAMTYRVGHHSTSDDSTKYRNIDDMKNWGQNYNPVIRLKNYLNDKQWWDDEKDQIMRDNERFQVLNALESAEKKPKPLLNELFTDVFHEKPKFLTDQENELREHILKYPEHYTASTH